MVCYNHVNANNTCLYSQLTLEQQLGTPTPHAPHTQWKIWV